MKSKIHFVSVLSVKNDLDLLPYFIPHYSALELDNYCLFLHEGPSPDANLWAERAAREAGWKARFIPIGASFGNGELKKVLLEKFQKACPKDDFIISADADELQIWNTSPHEILEGPGNINLVTGRRLDRFAEKLAPVNHKEDLEVTYPLEHENLSEVLFPKRIRSRDKIVLAKASLPVNFKKSKGFICPVSPGALNVAGDVPILHYKWRDNIFSRLNERADYTPEDLRAIRAFF